MVSQSHAIALSAREATDNSCHLTGGKDQTYRAIGLWSNKTYAVNVQPD